VGHHLTPSNNMGAAQEEVTAVDHLTPSSNMEATQEVIVVDHLTLNNNMEVTQEFTAQILEFLDFLEALPMFQLKNQNQN